MAATESRPGRLPPLSDLDDGGLYWHRDGDRFVLSRRTSLRAMFWPGLILIGLAVGGPFIFVHDSRLVGAFLSLAAILPAGLLWARIKHRYRIELSADGLRWQQTEPRAFHGRWPGGEVHGVRLVLGSRVSGLWRNRWVYVDLRRHGGWTRLASGLHKRKGVALANAISEARAWPLVVHDEEKDGAVDEPE